MSTVTISTDLRTGVATGRVSELTRMQEVLNRQLGGAAAVEDLRHLADEIDALYRDEIETATTEIKKSIRDQLKEHLDDWGSTYDNTTVSRMKELVEGFCDTVHEVLNDIDCDIACIALEDL